MTPPLHTLTTARLSLHDLVSEADYCACYAMDCDPMVVRYVGTGEAEKRPFEEYRDFMRGRLALWTSERFHMWAMCLHGSDEFLGWAILKPIRDTSHVEVGYRMPQSSWGKGYATEATRAVLDYGFNELGLEEITAVTHPDNTASQHVLTKCGLRRDGTLDYNGGGEIPFFRLPRSDYEKLST